MAELIHETGSLGGYKLYSPLAMRDSINELVESASEPWDVRESHLRFWALANSFTSYLGGRAGEGYVLMTKDGIDSLNKETLLDLKLGGGTGRSQTIKVVFLKAERILPQSVGGTKDVFLVTLTDSKWWAAMSSIDKLYNYRSIGEPGSAYFKHSLNGSSPWTWETMVEDVWSHLPAGVVGSYPGLPFAPHGTPEHFRYQCVSGWDAANDCIGRTGCAIQLDPFSGAYDIVQVGANDTAFDNSVATHTAAGLLLEHDENIEPDASEIPATIAVCFRAQHTDACEEAVICKPYHVINYGIAAYNAYAGTSLTAKAGTKLTIHDDMQASFTGWTSGASPSNLAILSNRAIERARDMFRMLDAGGANNRQVYSGILDFKPGSKLKSVTYRSMGDGPKTEIVNQFGDVWERGKDEYVLCCDSPSPSPSQ